MRKKGSGREYNRERIHRVFVRMNDVDLNMLDKVAEAAGKDRSATLRALVENAYNALPKERVPQDDN